MKGPHFKAFELCIAGRSSLEACSLRQCHKISDRTVLVQELRNNLNPSCGRKQISKLASPGSTVLLASHSLRTAMRRWTWGTIITLLYHITIYPYRVRQNWSPLCDGIHMRWSKQILRKLPSGLIVMSIMFSSWLSQLWSPPPRSHSKFPLLMWRDLWEAELLLLVSAHSDIVAFHSVREMNISEKTLCALVR